MNLQIGSGERDVLRRLVEEHSKTILYEIARADSRSFRDELQRELSMTEALRERLAAAEEEDVMEIQGP